MKIIQILPQLKEGGVETGTIDIARHLHKKGHEVFVISNGGPLVEELRRAGIPHLLWPVHHKHPWTILRMAFKLIGFLNREKIDIVHARSRVPGWITYLACLWTKTRWITTCHGYYRAHFGSRVMGWADKIIVASRSIQDHMIHDFHVPEQKIELIPRGVNLEKFHFRPPEPASLPTIGMIGRITPLKGHPDFLKALSLLRRQGIRFKAQIIGEAENKNTFKKLERLTAELGLNEQVEFLGHQTDIPDCLNKLNLLVLATTTPEAFGRVIIEAQAAGVPVVATRVGGVVDIIQHAKTGYLANAADPESLAAQIRQILDHPQKTAAMVDQARKQVEKHYTLAAMADKMEALYRECVQKKILIFKLGSLGDVILISASLRAIRQCFPDSKITVLTDPVAKPILDPCPYLDEIITVSKQERRTSSRRLSQFLKTRRFDISIDFQNSRWTHRMSYVSGIPHRYGFSRRWGWLFLNHRAKSKALPPVPHQFEILKCLNIHPETDRLEFWLSDKDRQAASDFLDPLCSSSNPLWMGIHIGASWETKRWRTHHIARFCDLIQKKYGYQVILTGTEKDKIFERQILSLTQHPVISIVGKTSLGQLAAVIEKCQLFVSSDSAPLHIAAALNVPTVALFGPTDSKRHSPPHHRLRIVQKKVTCGPCYRATCSHVSCMVKIEPFHVIENIEQLSLLK